MTFLLDHCTPHHYLKLLRDWGYDASLLKEHLVVNTPDPGVLQMAQELDAIILTVDKDFGNILQYPPHGLAGIVVIHDEVRARQAVAERLRQALAELYRDGLRGVLLIIEPDGYRVRRSAEE